MLVTEGLQQQPSSALKHMLRFVSSKSYTCSAAPHILFCTFLQIPLPGEWTHFFKNTASRSNGLDWTALPMGSQREGPGGATPEEMIRVSQKVNTVHKSKRGGTPSSRSVTKGHLKALYSSTAWCPTALQGTNMLTFSYFLRHVFSKLTCRESLLQ